MSREEAYSHSAVDEGEEKLVSTFFAVGKGEGRLKSTPGAVGKDNEKWT